ncbi:hypothetical protein E2C01_025303 [Portunus trituberculatus]|uniref:Uncharacterized protein n=1 Tax=Portunus trituberculatus TaxID=210409 RepID=A0A5B7ECW9_PORTR|nr:hypothetical protein [Portunus trituberculatus]
MFGAARESRLAVCGKARSTCAILGLEDKSMGSVRLLYSCSPAVTSLRRPAAAVARVTAGRWEEQLIQCL